MARIFPRKRSFFYWMIFFCLMSIALTAIVVAQISDAKRPMTFMDVLLMRSAGDADVSPDKRWLLYTLTVPDWKAGKRFSDIYLVSLQDGFVRTRQMTFTANQDESSPRWSRDGKLFVFTSNRDAPSAAAKQNQLYLMRPDGGEALKITDSKEGVGSFAFSRDGKWLAFSAGKEDERQIWILPTEGIEKVKPVQLTKHSAPVRSWRFSPDSARVYFTAPERVDEDNKKRKEKTFDVRIRNEQTPPDHLWFINLETKQQTRLTRGDDYSVSDVTVSEDSRWIGFRGTSNNRYLRTANEVGNYADLYLIEVTTGAIERLTNNTDIREGDLHFSPDSSLIAFSASDDFIYFRNQRVYLRRVSDGGGRWRKLGDGFDGDVSVRFWSRDGKTIYFNAGLHATTQLCALSLETGNVTPISKEMASLSVDEHEDSKTLLVNYSDPLQPSNLYTVDSIDQVGNRSSWKQLTHTNPQISDLALGETEVVQWKSTDGKPIEGILVKPVAYQKGKRYPLVVQIHGGPAGAVVLNFNASSSYYSHVYAGAGYACLLPNYRGSSNYGERHKMEISGDYFRQGYEDIMTGVDHLIETGLVDGERMGVMGWSAGGHWSNWILTHTNRFKAVSSGAGAVNWISMYAQSDIQRNREFYYQGQPYDRFEHYWEVSPLKYIKNARTPTLIHVVDGDPRVPRPQSEELHMALKKLGVPTEFLVYPGNTHGISEPRNQLVKMVAEFNWFEKWIRGKEGWFKWRDLLATIEDEEEQKEKPENP